MTRLAVLLLLGTAVAHAEPGAEDQAMGRRVQALLRAHQADVFGCVQANPGRAEGEMLVRVLVGEEGKAARADVLKDQSGGGRLGGCLVDKIRGWDLSSLGAGAGDQVVFPLAFHPDAAPTYVVHAPAEGGAPDAKVRARVLLDEQHLGATPPASLTVLTLDATVRLGQHTHPTGEAIYVLRGMVRVRQPGQPQVSLKAGEGAFIAGGQPHSLEAAPLAPAVLLQVFAPSGPEQAYADRKAPGTTPSRATKVDAPAFVAHESAPLSILGGKGAVRLLLDGSGAPVALDELAADAGAAVPRHKHDGSHELLYIVAGHGTTTVGAQSILVGPGDALAIPPGVEHALTVDDKLTAVQVYAPKGPEQRFKTKGPK
jgi:quercetin dioxygenase-like cupin family protein